MAQFIKRLFGFIKPFKFYSTNATLPLGLNKFITIPTTTYRTLPNSITQAKWAGDCNGKPTCPWRWLAM